MVQLMAFADVLRATERGAPRNLLAANGLSIEADEVFGTAEIAKNVGERLADWLQSAHLVQHYESLSGPVENRMASLNACQDCAGLVQVVREALIDVILQSAPDGQADFDASLCAGFTFLSKFASAFTTNYDPHMYWLTTHRIECELCPGTGWYGDGFGKSFEGADGFLRSKWRGFWSRELRPIWHMHGAMHLFAEDGAVFKVVSHGNDDRTELGRNLMPLIQDRRTSRVTPPLFVAEATAEAKLEQILANAYLSEAFAAFKKLEGHLVIHGSGLNAQDDHLWEAVRTNTSLSSISVSVHGDPRSDCNLHLVRRAKKMQRRSSAQPALMFYAAESADTWGRAA